MDTVVLDIETKQTFADVGGPANIDKLEISVVGIYSYDQNRYYCYQEDEFPQLIRFLAEPALLVGFRSNKFDLPIMNMQLGLQLFEYPRIDLMDEIEQRTGRLVSLDALARENLGVCKTGKSIMAPQMYWDGEIEKLKEYCLQDVKITKDLYDLARSGVAIRVPQKHTTVVRSVTIEITSWHF